MAGDGGGGVRPSVVFRRGTQQDLNLSLLTQLERWLVPFLGPDKRGLLLSVLCFRGPTLVLHLCPSA